MNKAFLSLGSSDYLMQIILIFELIHLNEILSNVE